MLCSVGVLVILIVWHSCLALRNAGLSTLWEGACRRAICRGRGRCGGLQLLFLEHVVLRELRIRSSSCLQLHTLVLRVYWLRACRKHAGRPRCRCGMDRLGRWPLHSRRRASIWARGCRG